MSTPPPKPVEGNGPHGYKSWSRRKKILVWSGGVHHREYQQRGEPAQARTGQSRDPEHASTEDPGPAGRSPEGRSRASTAQDHRIGQAECGRRASTGQPSTGRTRCSGRAKLHHADAGVGRGQ